MRRKRSDAETVKGILDQNETLKVTKEDDVYIFEIGGEITTDIAEAVSILMRVVEWNDPIWDMVVDKKIKNIKSEKSLFWLTGGTTEWTRLNNYNMSWRECFQDFQDEFGFIVDSVVYKSSTLKDIRTGFAKYLNLPVLYDYAISKNMIK